MTDKELRKLRRDDLLQILVSQQRQLDEANAALERSEQALRKREIAVSESGSVAEAALKLNGVFEAAQVAADQYLEQMRARADEMAAEAERKAEESRRVAQEVLDGARGEADRILREARAEAERLKLEAVQGGAAEATAPVGEAPGEDEGDGKRRRGLLRRNRKT